MATAIRATAQRPKTASGTTTTTTTITMKGFDSSRPPLALLPPVPRRSKPAKIVKNISTSSSASSGASPSSSSKTKAERRRSMPVPVMTAAGGFQSAGLPVPAPPLSPSSTSLYDHSTSGVLSPPLTPHSPRFPSDADFPGSKNTAISVDHLRSNSGLSLHTNNALLRRYTDYNMDGSSRLPSTTEEMPVVHEDYQARRSYDNRSTTSAPGVEELYSRETVAAVLQDPLARKQLRAFALAEGGVETLDFLEKVEEYCTAVHGVTALMATISTTFTSLSATKPLSLPPSLAKALNADIKHVSSSILPGLEMLFGEAGSHVEQRIVRDIYPAFIKRQFNMTMKASLGATSAAAAQTPFRFAGLGHAFCLTDPYRPNNPIVYASDSFAHVMGYARAEDIPRNGRLLRGPLPGEEEEFTEGMFLNSNRRDNQPFWSMVSACPLKSASGRVRFVLSGLANVSDAAQSREETLKALGTPPAALAPPTAVATSSFSGSSGSNASAASLSSGPYPPLSNSSMMTSSSGSLSNYKGNRPPSIAGSDATSSTGYDSKPGRASSASKSFFNNPFSRKRRALGTSAGMGPTRPTTSSGYETPQSETFPSSPGFSSRITESIKSDYVSNSIRVDDDLPMYSRFMVLQFVPGSSHSQDSAAPAPPLSRRASRNGTASLAPPATGASNNSRMKVAFCSKQMLELLGLGPAAHDAVLYHDVFAVLSELAGSPSITNVFKTAVRQRLAASEPASMELSVPASMLSTPGGFSAGLGVGMASPVITQPATLSITGSSSRRSSMFVVGRSKQDRDDDDSDSCMEETRPLEGWFASAPAGRRRGSFDRPATSAGRVREPPKMQRLMSHWTPLKDVDGSIAWIMLVISPVVEH